jgi:hypothetical protein
VIHLTCLKAAVVDLIQGVRAWQPTPLPGRAPLAGPAPVPGFTGRERPRDLMFALSSLPGTPAAAHL